MTPAPLLELAKSIARANAEQAERDRMAICKRELELVAQGLTASQAVISGHSGMVETQMTHNPMKLEAAIFCACGGAWFGNHRAIAEQHIRRDNCREVSHEQFKAAFRCNCDECDHAQASREWLRRNQ